MVGVRHVATGEAHGTECTRLGNRRPLAVGFRLTCGVHEVRQVALLLDEHEGQHGHCSDTARTPRRRPGCPGSIMNF